MSGRRQQLARQIAKAQVKSKVIWLTTPDYMIAPDFKAKCHHGVNWIDGKCFAKDATTGLVIGVIAGGTSTEPPQADVEIAAKGLLAEFVEQHHQLTLKSIRQMRDALIRQGEDPDDVLRRAREKREELKARIEKDL